MQPRRVYAAGVVLGVTVAAAVWLLTYRGWQTFEYIGRDGRPFHPPEHVRMQPWWSVPATVAVLLAGTGASLWLLPGHRGLIRRLADHIAGTRHAGDDERPRQNNVPTRAPGT